MNGKRKELWCYTEDVYREAGSPGDVLGALLALSQEDRGSGVGYK